MMMMMQMLGFVLDFSPGWSFGEFGYEYQVGDYVSRGLVFETDLLS